MERRNEPLIAAFATALAKERTNMGLTQEELAARADVSARFVSQLETGRRQPSLSALCALSKGLGMRLQDLTGQVEVYYQEAMASAPEEIDGS